MKRFSVILKFWLLILAPTLHAATPPNLGVEITCPYMPYGDGVSQIIYLTNPSAINNAVTVSAFDDAGNEYLLGELGTANGQSVTKLSTKIRDALELQGFTSGKVALEIACNNSEVRAHFEYNAGTVRGYVPSHRKLFPYDLAHGSIYEPEDNASTPALGLKTTIPYMPYSESSSQILYITNPSSVTTDINVTAYDDQGETYDLGMIVAAPSRRITKITTLIQTALTDKLPNGSGKVTFEIECDNPEILVYASYTAGSYRGYVAPVSRLYVLPETTP